jgi:hypothetical protein
MNLLERLDEHYGKYGNMALPPVFAVIDVWQAYPKLRAVFEAAEELEELYPYVKLKKALAVLKKEAG